MCVLRQGHPDAASFDLAAFVRNSHVGVASVSQGSYSATLERVLAEHRRLFAEPVPPGVNRVLVGHRTPAILVLGEQVGGRAFPEGAALVLDPGAGLLGILMLAEIPGGGFHSCQ